MQNKTILLGSAFLLYSSMGLADNVVLRSRQTPINNTNKAISDLPFKVDVSYGQLSLHMMSANNLCIVVTGPEGVVLSQEIQATQEKLATFDLTPYQNGNYEVHIIDAKGNDVSGEFFKDADHTSTDNENE